MELVRITTEYHTQHNRWLNIGEFNPKDGNLWVGDVLSADKRRYEIKLDFADYLKMAIRKQERLSQKKSVHKNIIDIEKGIVDICV